MARRVVWEVERSAQSLRFDVKTRGGHIGAVEEPEVGHLIKVVV